MKQIYTLQDSEFARLYLSESQEKVLEYVANCRSWTTNNSLSEISKSTKLSIIRVRRALENLYETDFIVNLSTLEGDKHYFSSFGDLKPNFKIKFKLDVETCYCLGFELVDDFAPLEVLSALLSIHKINDALH